MLYLPKKSAPEWPRNKLLATTCQVPENGYNFLILFLPLWNQLKLVFDPPEWDCWMFWNMVASAGTKYIILKYSERLGKQEQIGQVLQALRF